MENTKKSCRCPFDGCNKKLKIHQTVSKCKCGLAFCDVHRMPESHDCVYDYKQDTTNKDNIEKMKCVASKMAVKV